MKIRIVAAEVFLSTLFIANAIVAQEWHWQCDDLVLNPSGLDLSNAVSWAWGDLNDDGLADILVRKSLYFDDGSLVAYRGQASLEPPYWVEAPELLAGLEEPELSYGISLADLDGDGELNLITRVQGDTSWKMLYWRKDVLNNWFADSIVFENVNISELREHDDPFFADVDTDNDLDMLLSTPSPKIFVPGVRFFENVGTRQQPAWQEDSTRLAVVYENFLGYQSVSATLMCVDADTLLDLLVVFTVEDVSDVLFYPGVSDSLGLRWRGTPENLNINTTGGAIGKLLPFDIERNTKQALLALDLLGTATVYQHSGASDSFFDKSCFRLGPMRFQFMSSIIPFDYLDDSQIDLLAIGHFRGFFGDVTSFQSYQRDSLAGMRFWRNTQWFGNPLGSPDVFDFKAQLVDLDKNSLLDFVMSYIPSHYSAVYENPLADFKGEWELRTELLRPFLSRPFGSDTTYFDPSFADLDGDGDFDLLIAEMLFFKTDSGRARYKFFENSLIADSVSWKMRDDWWAGLTEISYSRGNRYGANLYGNFADLDKDGDADLIFGTREGELSYYENTGSTASPAWALRPEVFAGIDVGDFASPSFGDFDKDGRIDLFVGNVSGELFFFRNEMIVSIEEQSADAPRTFYLHQNYPNPFNSGTMITYEIPRDSHVQLLIYDLLGHEVAKLVNEQQNAGTHRVAWRGEGVASGLYFYELRFGDQIQRQKLVFLK